MSEHYGLFLEHGVIGLKGHDAPATGPVKAKGPDDEEPGEPVREPDPEDGDGSL